jgi:hypothetical protein
MSELRHPSDDASAYIESALEHLTHCIYGVLHDLVLMLIKYFGVNFLTCFNGPVDGTKYSALRLKFRSIRSSGPHRGQRALISPVVNSPLAIAITLPLWTVIAIDLQWRRSASRQRYLWPMCDSSAPGRLKAGSPHESWSKRLNDLTPSVPVRPVPQPSFARQPLVSSAEQLRLASAILLHDSTAG